MPDRHYENLAEIEDHYWWHQGRAAAAHAFIKSLLSSGQLSQDSNIADVGCGTGGFLKQLQAAFGFRNVAGIDGSPQALKVAKERGMQGIQANLSEPFSVFDGKCDLITMMDVLEHMPDEDQFLQSVNQNLPPGGYLMINVPAFQFLFSSWDKLLGHHRRYTRSRLKSVLQKNGFEILRCSYLFSTVFPIAIMRRLFGKEFTSESCEFPAVPSWLNKFLISASKVESRLIQAMPLPFGTSVFCLARKKHG